MTRAADRRIRRLYERIPETGRCVAGCHACCGSVPWSPVEAHRVESHPDRMGTPETRVPDGIVIGKIGDDCPFLTACGCGVYDDRPLICRLFGAVDHPLLTCPKGVQAKHPMSESDSRALVSAVNREGRICR